MSNLAKTQAQWTRLLGRELATLLLAPIREAREQRDKFTRERIQVVNWNDYNSNLDTAGTGVTLSGVDYGNNTATDGRLFVEMIDAGGGDWTVKLFKAAGNGGSDLMCSGTAAAGAVVTMTASNSSGLTGTWDLPATPVANTDDVHQLLVFVDYPARLPKALTQTDGVEDDMFSRRDIAAFYARCAARRTAEIADAINTIGRWALASQDNPVARGNAFAGTNYGTLFSDTPSEDSSGNVERLRTGFLVFIKDAMEDEGTGGEQDVVKRIVAAGAGSFDAGNDGSGTVASHTPTEAALPGTHYFECIDDTLGQERFSHSFKASDSDLVEFTTQGPIVGKLWSGARGIGPITLLRTKTKSNDGSNNVFAATSGCTVTGENSLNTDDGDVFASIAANGSNWDVSFYSSSGRHSSTLVAKATNVAASAAFTATQQNSSGLTIAWTLGGTVSAVSNITLSLNPFKVQNANNVADKFSIAVTLTAGAGLIQTILAEELGATLNSDTSGSESISDNYAKAGTFTPFVTLDN